VLLRVHAHQEGGNVDELLPDPDVALSDQDTGMVDGLGQRLLEDLGLRRKEGRKRGRKWGKKEGHN